RRLRQSAAVKYGRTGAALMALSAGKGHVVYTSLDITCGLLGTDTGGILGYEPAYAQALVKNVLFWALDGQKDRAEAPPPPAAAPRRVRSTPARPRIDSEDRGWPSPSTPRRGTWWRPARGTGWRWPGCRPAGG